ncbi:unnamed protein product [Trifolium pratense]|uniref:Uncharacterized protein n=1 Tax=Trifolium pratense TaxID=57577 RepID=A0ACB0JR60_TRIPR|nr:unnamed protein product [Trifolium pratense]
MNQNVSNNSTSTNNNPSPPNSPSHTPNEIIIDEGFETIAKTSEEVLAAELNALNDETNKNDIGGANEDGGAQGGVPRSMFVALIGDGSNTSMVEQVGGDNHVQPFKKRKYKLVRDPPIGIPTCPVCKKEFATWRAAFGHMNKHPDRPYRGFFPPPTFTPTASVAGIHVEDDCHPKEVDDEGVLAVVRELIVDLNRSRSIEVPAKSSTAGGSGRNEEVPALAPKYEEGRRKNVFDLNELPPNDDDDDDKIEEK